MPTKSLSLHYTRTEISCVDSPGAQDAGSRNLAHLFDQLCTYHTMKSFPERVLAMVILSSEETVQRALGSGGFSLTSCIIQLQTFRWEYWSFFSFVLFILSRRDPSRPRYLLQIGSQNENSISANLLLLLLLGLSLLLLLARLSAAVWRGRLFILHFATAILNL